MTLSTAKEALPPAPTPPAAPDVTQGVAGPVYALSVLFLVYALNYLDRTLIFILFPPIKKEMHLSDLQMALLGSTSFVIFYTLLGIPFGRLADRVVRRNLIAAGLTLWTLCSGATGFMVGFAGIFTCRVLVGVGEATLGPAALSLLSDYFPPRRRATVQAIYSAGIPLGSGAALFLGGLIAQRWGWRWAFYLLGFPGLLLTLLVLTLREPRRGQTEAPAASEGPPADWRLLFRVPALRYHYLGYALSAVAGNALSMWVPTYLHRVFGVDLAHAGMYTGGAAVLGGMAGAVLGGVGADRWNARQAGGRMRFCALGALVAAPLWIVLLHTGSLAVLIGCHGLLMGCGLLWLGPAAADMHDIVGPRLRGLGIGVYFFVVNVIGYGVGPPIIGYLNDVLGATADPTAMRRALLLCPAACVLSALCLFRGSQHLRATLLRRR